MRLFIAVQLNQEMKNALITMQNDLYDAGIRGNYTSEENLHMTLAFIGEYEPDPVSEILESISFDPFLLSLTGIGSFGNLWWAGFCDPPELETLVKRIRRALSDAGIPFDRKKFRPHATLLRNASAAVFPQIEIPDVSMQVSEISLMRSERGKHGMKYTEVQSFEADFPCC